jgi:phenylacetate-CoA ligase
MKGMHPTPLESWIQDRISAPRLDADTIHNYQLSKLRETVAFVRRHSTFYTRHLSNRTENDLGTLEDLREFPFTTAAHLSQCGLDFLCVSQDAVERVVTLETSGTTGGPKRLFFTREDLERTIDFFAHGMSDFVNPGGRVLILLPGDRPDSVGDLLARGIDRIGADGIIHGPVRDPEAAVNAIQKHDAECIIGIPVQVLAMARSGGLLEKGRLKNVILTTDYVPKAIVQAVESAWGCRVFNHYGMTETGYGGGLECSARTGYHLREADLFFEIVDPFTGRPKNDGELGEVVFTTLTRMGMPLIRYRTGDQSRFLPGPCGCGARLSKMTRVRTRLARIIHLTGGGRLTPADLDEALFPISNLLDYRAELMGEASRDLLQVELHLNRERRPDAVNAAYSRLQRVPALAQALSADQLILSVSEAESEWPVSAGTAKRLISDHRKHIS